MKLLRFTFSDEAVWMMILAAAPGVISLFVLLVVFFLRR